MIKILIADDHTIVREGLKQMLMTTDDMTVASEAANGFEALSKLSNDDIDVLILDIAMPGRGGLDILKEVKSRWPKLAVLVLSMYPEDQYAIRVLRAGGDGYLTKESIVSELINAIRKVYSGKKYLSPYVTERIASVLSPDASESPHKQLSDREYQILCMIASGSRRYEIADKLALSTKTIATYRARILKKMSLQNNEELIQYAIRNQLINL